MVTPHPQPASTSGPFTANPRRRMLALVLSGALLVTWALFTIGQGLYLSANGVSTPAEVVRARHVGRSDLVRVRLASGHETELWAWKGTPGVGERMTVVYLEERDWARDAEAFAPMRRIWAGLGMGIWLLVVALVERSWRARQARGRTDPPADGGSPVGV
ncbi:hypothetical protein V6U77_03800 [Micromonospora sp. CPCC 205546]|uniref:hypothetical protein n=1 Tax=Micromonospora sp. CPCC 205546 TaxID=3122397 RepID=UPI002FF27ABA